MLNQPRLMISFLVWLWLTIIILFLFIAQIGPFHFLLSEDLILLAETGKLFFIIFGLPLLLNRSTSEATIQSFQQGLKALMLFFLFFLPLTISGVVLAGFDWLVIIMGHLLMMIIWFLIIGLNYLSAYVRINPWRWYYLIALTITAVLPVLYYLIAELFNQFISALLYINPFWLFWRLDQKEVFYQGWLFQVMICLVLIIVLIGIKHKVKPKIQI